MPEYAVREWIDILHVQGNVARFAAGIGFSKRECQELAIVASELASNILKYGKHGTLAFDLVADGAGLGISLVASDHGPPFKNLEWALLDGYDDNGPIDPLDLMHRKGIGGGLGAVVRFTHSFRVEHLQDGKQVLAVRYLTAKGLKA